jgi:hypothetical protein
VIELTYDQLLIGVLALVAGLGIGVILYLFRRKYTTFKKLCFDIAAVAKDEGFDLAYEIMESIATEDMEELKKEIESLHKLATTPGALNAHIDKLFFVQLTKRFADDARRQAVLDAIDQLQAGVDVKMEKYVAAYNAKKGVAAE